MPNNVGNQFSVAACKIGHTGTLVRCPDSKFCSSVQSGVHRPQLIGAEHVCVHHCVVPPYILQTLYTPLTNLNGKCIFLLKEPELNVVPCSFRVAVECDADNSLVVVCIESSPCRVSH